MNIIPGGHIERAFRKRIFRTIQDRGHASAMDMPENARNLKVVFTYLDVMQQMVTEGLLEFKLGPPEPWLREARFQVPERGWRSYLGRCDERLFP